MAGSVPVTAASSALELLPVSRWHWRLVVFAGLGTFFDLYEVFLGGVLAPVLAKEFVARHLGKSMVIAAGFAGMFIGANALSVAADRLGRRRVFILNLARVLAVLIGRRLLARTWRHSSCCGSLPASGWAPSWCSSTPTWPSSSRPASVGE